MTSGESELDRMTRRLKGPQAVVDACEAAREFGASQWLEEDELARLCILIEEWMANLYDHAGLSTKDEVLLAIACEPAGLRITIVDPGKPFDPRDVSAQIERLERGGGAGIGIMRAWAEFAGYEVTPAGNQLEMLMPIRWRG
jgi:anti-sigma regulatory factor (Ser/Thr protein kinase)